MIPTHQLKYQLISWSTNSSVEDVFQVLFRLEFCINMALGNLGSPGWEVICCFNHGLFFWGAKHLDPGFGGSEDLPVLVNMMFVGFIYIYIYPGSPRPNKSNSLWDDPFLKDSRSYLSGQSGRCSDFLGKRTRALTRSSQEFEPLKNPGWLGYLGNYTTQLYRDCNKPL